MAKYIKTEQGYKTVEEIGAATVEQVETAQTTAETAQITAETAQITANRKMNANNPVGTGSFSMGRNLNAQEGENSFAVGESVDAPHRNMHVIGAFNASPKELGIVTTDLGTVGVSKFDTTVYSMGYVINADRTFSLAEPILSTSNSNLPVGCYTWMSSTNYRTSTWLYQLTNVVAGTNGTAIARISLKFEELPASQKGTYAHIVGNGTSDNTRSNAHTLDWEGNAWYAGDVYVGSTSGTNRDEGSKKLATEEYVDSPHDAFLLTDAITNLNYHIFMKNGLLTQICKGSSIIITTLPNNLSYTEGTLWDPTGIELTLIREDATAEIIKDFTYYNKSDTIITFEYKEFNCVYTVDLEITKHPFDPTVELIDFTYNDNGDGTYTLTGWNETYNGEPSTELIIPDNTLIIL